MSKAHPPELKKFMDKKLSLKLNGSRTVTGILRGFDPFMNLVMDECFELCQGGVQNDVGMVVRPTELYRTFSEMTWPHMIAKYSKFVVING